MENKRSNLVTGIILISVGLLLFGVTNDFIDLDLSLRKIARFWPLFIVLAGIAVFFNERKTVFNPISALLIAFSIPLGIYHGSTKVIDEVKTEFNDDFNFDIESDENDSETYNDSTKVFDGKQSIDVPFDAKIENGKLDFAGGASEFFVSEASSTSLFEASTKNFNNKFKVNDEKNGNTLNIDFDMDIENKKINLGDEGFNKELMFKLNKKLNWDIEMKIGAGNLEFDLSDYKIQRIDLKTGATNVDIKLGEKLAESKIKIESGVAKIRIRVPKGSGCEIKMDGALNAKDFDNFTKISSGLWRSDGYDKSSKKVFLELKSGLSVVEVDRY